MNHRSLALLFVLFLALLACSPEAFFASATPTNPPDLIATEVVRARAVAATLTAEAPKPTQTSRVVTATPLPPPTAAPTAPPTATLVPPTASPTLPPSRIRNLQPMEVPWDAARRLQLVAEYSYNGEWGADKIFISATAWNDKAQILEIYSDRQPIVPGEGVVQMELILHDRGTYITSRIQLCMFAEGSVPRVYCQFWPYAKTWKM